MEVHSELDLTQYEKYRGRGGRTDNRYYIASMAAGFVLAVLFMLFAVKKDSAAALVFGEEYFENFRLVNVNKMEFWGYVLLNRSKWLLVWIFIGLNPYHRKIYMAASGLVGVFVGMTTGAIFINFGFEGIGLLFWTLLPHGIFYFFSGMLVVKRSDCERMIWQKTLIVLFLAVISMLIGCALESFVNPLVLQKMIK